MGDGTGAEANKGPRLIGLLTLAGVVIATALSLTTFLFTLFPGWRPDPRERSDADVRVLGLDKNVSQVDYFRRVGIPENDYEDCTPEKLNSLGNVVYIQAETAGFKRSGVLLRWFTYIADNKRRQVHLSSNSEKTRVFEPRAPIDRQIAEVWIQNDVPEDDTSYFIRFQLYSGNVLRAFADTRPFTIPEGHQGEKFVPACRLKLRVR